MMCFVWFSFSEIFLNKDADEPMKTCTFSFVQMPGLLLDQRQDAVWYLSGFIGECSPL